MGAALFILILLIFGLVILIYKIVMFAIFVLLSVIFAYFLLMGILLIKSEKKRAKRYFITAGVFLALTVCMIPVIS